MGNLYIYDPATNEVTKSTLGRLTYDQFSHEPREDHVFWVDTRLEDEKMELYSDELECLILNSTKQTEEQAVILFATLLGLREQATEEA